jgi:drug/metabolite transporter (DMT)-like permease
MIGERAGRAVWFALAIGFVGAAASLAPALTIPEMQLGVLAAITAAVASAGSQTAVRRLTATNSPSVIVLIYTAVSLLATAPMAIPVWITPPAADWPILAILGLLALTAQYAAARGFALAPVSFLAPLDFLSVPAGALLGFALFGEVPSVHTLIGGTLILAAAVMVTGRESKKDVISADTVRA